MILKPLTRTHGGKWYLKDWIIGQFPSNYHELKYIEPFIGGGSVFLNKKPGPFELINDINPDLISLWNTVKLFSGKLIMELSSIPYTEQFFQIGLEGKYYSKQANYYIKSRMSRGGLGKSFAWSDRLRGGKPGDVNAWETSIENIPNISKRLENTWILSYNVFDLLCYEGYKSDSNMLIYCDPPYVSETRTAKKAYGQYEMSIDDHVNLAHLLNKYSGKVLISGYPSTLYDDLYKNWNISAKDIANNSGQGKRKQRRTEMLWKNY